MVTIAGSLKNKQEACKLILEQIDEFRRGGTDKTRDAKKRRDSMDVAPPRERREYEREPYLGKRDHQAYRDRSDRKYSRSPERYERNRHADRDDDNRRKHHRKYSDSYSDRNDRHHNRDKRHKEHRREDKYGREDRHGREDNNNYDRSKINRQQQPQGCHQEFLFLRHQRGRP